MRFNIFYLYQIMSKGRFLNLLKYIKQRVLRKSRYYLTKRVKAFLKEENSLPMEQAEIEKIGRFLKSNLIEIFNYPFVHKYNFRKTRIFFDEAKDLNYVCTSEGYRLYFKKGMSEKQIEYSYNSLCKEQDKESPHCYFFEELHLTKNTVVADIGSAEGNFSLMIIDKIKELYLFECDDDWRRALEATFEPWKDKVHIVNKYVSNGEKPNTVSLDEYFQDKEPPTLLKLDVEGAEADVLDGAELLLKQRKISDLLVCTYHKHGDAEILAKKLEKWNYSISYTKGYMLFLWEEENYQLKPPYDFRKGLLHAKLMK